MSTSIILLAAGSSRRFGEDDKLLATVGGTPLVRVVAETLLKSAAREVVVVTGQNVDAIREALGGLAVKFVDNPQHADGIGTSIAAGIRGLDSRASGAMIVPADMPQLSVALVGALLGVFADGGSRRVVYPATPEGEQRNPVIWPRKYFAELARLSGDKGGKELLSRPAIECDVVVVDDADVFFDIDTPEDLANLQRDIQITKAQDAR